tara:strand:- start:75 stop:569 length:495 start_codon:yes stop_codon:yes gene_type:complete
VIFHPKECPTLALQIDRIAWSERKQNNSCYSEVILKPAEKMSHVPIPLDAEGYVKLDQKDDSKIIFQRADSDLTEADKEELKREGRTIRNDNPFRKNHFRLSVVERAQDDVQDVVVSGYARPLTNVRFKVVEKGHVYTQSGSGMTEFEKYTPPHTLSLRIRKER